MKPEMDLNSRLDHYASTASGENTAGRGAADLAGYAAAAGVGLAMAGTADAGIVYSGVHNIAVSINPAAQATGLGFTTNSQTSIDLDGGGADVNLRVQFNGVIGYPGTNDVVYGGSALLQGIGGAALLGPAGTGLALNLAASNTVGPGGSFAGTCCSGAGFLKQNRYTFVSGNQVGSTTAGNFNPFPSTGFVGIRLASGNYGWIRLKVEDLGDNQPYTTILSQFNPSRPPIGNGQNFADRITVVDWAYETSGGAIHVGDTSSAPEPSPLALLAAGAVGIGAFRRRKAQQAETC